MLRHLRLLALPLALLAASAPAQSTVNELRESANAKLAAGAFADAIGDLQALIQIQGESKKPEVVQSLEYVYFQLALCHFLTGDFASAEPAFQTFIKKYPRGNKTGEAAVYVADTQRFTKRLDKAVDSYAAALKRYPSLSVDLVSDIHAGTARCYLAQDDWDNAIPSLLKTIETAIDPYRRSWAATLVATAYLKTIQLEKLYPLVPFLLTRTSFANSSIAFNMAALEAGDALFSEERYREALWIHRLVFPHDTIIEHSQKALELLQQKSDFESRHPSNPRVIMRLQENIGELEAEIEAMNGVDNYDNDLEYRIARGYMEQMRSREACEKFLHLHDAADGELAEEALFYAFQCATRFTPWDKAYEIGEEYIVQYPEGRWFEPLTFMMTQMYAREQKWETVASHVDRILKIRPNHQLEADCRYLGGYACFMLERFDDALAHFSTIREKFPQHELLPAVVYWAGMTHLFTGDYEPAAKDFDEVVRVHTGSQYVEDATFRRAVCEYGLQEFASAEKMFAEFVARYPDSKLKSEALMTEGDAAGALGRLPEAISSYRQALDIYYRHAGDDDFNIEHYNHCSFQCGQILTDDEQWAEAYAFYQDYIKRNVPESNIPLAVYWSGKCLLQTNGELDALHYYRTQMESLGSDRKNIGVDMILDEWIGLSKKLTGEQSRIAWHDLNNALAAAVASHNATLTLHFQRMFLYKPEILPEDKERLETAILSADALTNASPGVLQYIIDTAPARGKPALALDASREMIAAFPETDYALDARIVLADDAHRRALDAERGSDLRDSLYKEAVDYLTYVREVYASAPEAGKALIALGTLYTERGDTDAAEQAYKDILGNRDWRPLWPEALHGRGICAMKARNYLEASAYFERIYLLYSGYASWTAKAYLRRAECLQKLSRPDKAREVLQEFLSIPDLKDTPEAADAEKLLQNL